MSTLPLEAWLEIVSAWKGVQQTEHMASVIHGGGMVGIYSSRSHLVVTSTRRAYLGTSPTLTSSRVLWT